MDSTFSEIARYFDRQDSLRRLRQLAVAPEALGPNRIYCHIVPVLPPLSKAPTHSGFTSSKTKPRPPTATLIVFPLAGNPQAGVSMIREDGSWSFRPCIIGDLHPKGFYVPFDQTWAEVLCRLSAKTFLPLLHFQSSNPFIAAGILNEINARKSIFDYRGPFKFFSHQGDALAWVVASMWHSWEQRLLSQHERLDQLSKFISHNLNSLQYHELRPEAVAAKLTHKQIILPDFDGKPHPIFSFPQASSPALTSFNKSVIEARMQSVAASAKFKRPKVTSAKNSRTAAELHFTTKGFWWWRGIASEPKLLIDFVTKWDTSAFFYEFRARQNKNCKSDPALDSARTPWIDLDSTQKGILQHLCPSENLMKKQKMLLQLAPQKRNLYTCEIFLARPLDEVLAEVRLLWEDVDAQIQSRITVDPKRPNELPDGPLKLLKPKLSSKWTLLEDLDVLQFMGSSAPRLSKTQQVLQKREANKYRSMCEHAGILP